LDFGLGLLDQRFKQNPARYVLQCLLATVSILIVLALLDTILGTTVIASLGASCFIAFTMPGKAVSRPRFLIGGYLVGLASGALCRCLFAMLGLAELPGVGPYADAFLGALAVGLAIFVMVITDTEHPPAAGLALGIMLNERFSVPMLGVVLIGIVSLSIAKEMLKPVLIDLL
jgi:CBS-domain-containing membrane protein